MSHVKLPPVSEFARNPPYVTAAIGTVKDRLLSKRKPGRMKRLRIFGKVVEIVLSASRFVDIYRPGRIGAPAAAEIYANEPTPAFEASFASIMAESRFISS
jgi:hypothetical protein